MPTRSRHEASEDKEAPGGVAKAAAAKGAKDAENPRPIVDADALTEDVGPETVHDPDGTLSVVDGEKVKEPVPEAEGPDTFADPTVHEPDGTLSLVDGEEPETDRVDDDADPEGPTVHEPDGTISRQPKAAKRTAEPDKDNVYVARAKELGAKEGDTITVVGPALAAFGTNYVTGDVIDVGPAAHFLSSVDAEGNSWLDLTAKEQVERFGVVVFKRGKSK